MERYSEIVQILLHKIGITTLDEAEAFINPSYDEHLHDPFLMAGMSKAVDRILRAISDGEKIAVYSDFDADGIPAGVILHDFFKKIGFDNFVNYIPHRHTEGYGFHQDAVEKLAKDDVGLIITVDVGITAVDAVKHASELGIDVIITDHHEPKEGLPDAIAILNPKQVHCQYPFDGLCGAGVAYKLIQALIIKGKQQQSKALMFKESPEGWEKWLLDLVAIATVADMVPLVGENRVLVHWGLIVLHKSKRVGIQALCNKLRIKQQLLDENDIGFSIAPRINAASRMGCPEDAFNLLSTTDMLEAEMLASKLESLNNKRKGQVAAMVRKINIKIEQMKELGDLPRVIVVGDPSWSPALVGLAAGSLADKLDKVVCVWGREGTGVLKGSCRSGDGTSVIEMFQAVGDALLYFGGHHAAGGFAVDDEYIHTLGEALSSAHASVSTNEHTIESVSGDIKMLLKQVNYTTLNEFKALTPFGVGNPKPVLSFNSVEVTSVRHFGKEQNHIEIYIKDTSGYSRKASKFFATSTSFSKEVIEGVVVTLLANIEESSFAGRRTLELRIVDIV
ncbi:MAG: single-stranded-DNA-specific exonuclease RecJ [Candidatus Pacebacteria bacterium]|nr:single-stranded-DNA-specific exonuclease RecJ [Candidatus Paceibacterota bacterium]